VIDTSEEVSFMQYGYVRVSTVNQNVDRQVDDMHKLGLIDSHIYIDKESGKDFNRTNYRRLCRRFKKGDVLVVKAIDRLGRNYNMILDEWRKLTKEKEVDIVVIDMPLLDTRIEGKNLVGKFIADVVLQVLSFVAQNERETMKQRQAEGIRMAKLRGVKFGRPRIALPNGYERIAGKFLNGEITSDEACAYLKMSRGTFFRNLTAKRIKKQP
jgi:DNA invertase Pin-like site-specific DNA recombinase